MAIIVACGLSHSSVGQKGTAHCRWQEIYLWTGKQKQNASFIHHKSREADCFKHERTTQEYITNHALQFYLTLTRSTRCLLMQCQCKINHWRKYIHGEIDQLSFRIHLYKQSQQQWSLQTKWGWILTSNSLYLPVMPSHRQLVRWPPEASGRSSWSKEKRNDRPKDRNRHTG